jgi:tetratricopeptide (TPR) repeat protein
MEDLMKLVIFLISILLVFNGLTFGQERFLMDQNTFQKFKQAKRMYVKGEQLFLKGKLSKAQESLDKCVEVFPKYSEAYFILAQVHYKQKDYATALDHISSAKTHFKFMSDIRVSTQLEYIDTLREQRQKLQEQVRNLQEQLASAKSSADKSRIESAIGSAEGQISQIDNRMHSPIPNIESVPAEYFYVHGNIFFKTKKFQEAHKQYLETIKVDPNHGNALNNLSTLYFMVKKYNKAKDFMDRAEASGFTVSEKFKSALMNALGK